MIDVFTKTLPPQRDELNELEGLFDVDPEGVYLPSHEQIVQECTQIRRKWSEREHRKRSVEKVQLRWRPPTIHLETDVQNYLNE